MASNDLERQPGTPQQAPDMLDKISGNAEQAAWDASWSFPACRRWRGCSEA
jgi:hypothetical protein